MPKLVMKCVSEAYTRISYIRVRYIMTEWIILREETKNEGLSSKGIRIGAFTFGAEALFKLFIEGKKVEGEPTRIIVKLSSREARIFRMIEMTGVYSKRKIWVDFLEGKISKKELLKKLEKELSVHLLSKKLEGGG